MTDRIIVSMKTEALEASLLGKRAALDRNVRRAITKLSIELQTHVKEDKLTGQVLHVKTGTLRRSINRLVIDRGDTVIGQVGTNVPYAHFWEYGFNGVENVREHARRNASGTVSNVRAHTRTVNQPARSFLRSSLADMADQIRTELKDAVMEALKP